jgi:carbamoyl-phosphate synthase large subunit
VPKRTDLRKILLIGSGPIVIGQACEFDYAGTQACKALREEGFEVVLVNSNPATIMTDPEMADRTYVEPLTPEVLERVIAEERPQALLPTLGGQTGLNLAVALAERGVLDAHGVELIGAKLPAIRKAEDREAFKAAIQKIGLSLPRSGLARSVEEARDVVREIGYPVILRPSFTLGGTGGSVAWNPEELEGAVRWGLQQSPVGQVLVEESVIGWKEFELEVMRDLADNVVIVCSIENVDPMGIHTGDSITVAPAQTLTDKEYQAMRDAALAIIREIGVETGGSNIQFAVDPRDGRMVVIEMNPRVSRSSALASKATGFPIAKIAAKLAVGYTLDELRNDITRETPASFEPTIDYCVVKIPRWAFEKFPEADQTLTTQMKSVGEVMAIGRTFKEALQKALRSLEQDRYGFGLPGPALDPEELRTRLRVPTAERIVHVAEAIRAGLALDEIAALTRIDPWFLAQIEELVRFEEGFRRAPDLSAPTLRRAKRLGFSDRRLAELAGGTEGEVRRVRLAHGVRATFKMVDTCAAEFVAHTPYLYSTYEDEDEAPATARPKVVILGSGPNRIGQGIEFDYACVHAAFALREAAPEPIEAIMVNCNPETVSTDYDTSDRLYFEPLTLEDVLNVVEKERPLGVVVQFGGQTPLKLAAALARAGVPILGTQPDAIDRAEDRARFADLLRTLGLNQPPNGSARSVDEAARIAAGLGYPVLVRPSYVLGGRAMEIVYEEERLRAWMTEATRVAPEHPILVDKFLEDALEIDVDAVADGRDVFVGGVMEHIEKAGIHSGDSACALPPYSIGDDQVARLRAETRALALELGVVGLLNIQFAIRHETVYVLEVNPRASRTVPFVSKAIGIPLAKLATRVLLGARLRDLGLSEPPELPHVAVKEAVFPFVKFPGVDVILGPEMRSTGEVMGLDREFPVAYLKSQLAAGSPLPRQGRAFLSVRNRDKRGLVPIARSLYELGFRLVATQGTAKVLERNGMRVDVINKVAEGWRPNIVDLMKQGEVRLVINTPEDGRARRDSYLIRRTAVMQSIPYYTTIEGAQAALAAIEAQRAAPLRVRPLQAYYGALR